MTPSSLRGSSGRKQRRCGSCTESTDKRQSPRTRREPDSLDRVTVGGTTVQTVELGPAASVENFLPHDGGLVAVVRTASAGLRLFSLDADGRLRWELAL